MIAASHLEFLKSTLPSNCFLSHDHPDAQNYAQDWTKPENPAPSCIIFPKTTEQVSNILKYCFEHHLAVIPSGGRTGLAGGANSLNGEIVLSLEKMQRVIEANPTAMTLKVEAGVTTETAQLQADNMNLKFAVDLAAKGSSQIGGNIATNAGGLRYIRYGGMREAVLGLKVVLADGEVLDLSKPLYKDNSGFDLKHLFIGSEGCLGVITEATLKLVQKPKPPSLLLLAVDSFEHVLSILCLLRKNPAPIGVFEFFSHQAYQIVHSVHPNIELPLEGESPYYLLIEIESTTDEFEEIYLPTLESMLNQQTCLDAFIPENHREHSQVWAIRERITESLAASGHVHKNDISVPITNLAEFAAQATTIVQKASQTIQLIMFGHVGDGNIHLNYFAEKTSEKKHFFEQCKQIENKIYQLTRSLQGSISAEHGIGTLKKDHLHYSRTEEEINWMRKIKTTFDPKGIMNPGKLLP